MATKKQILEDLIELEHKHHLLSADAIWQQDLIIIQGKLAKIMAKLANDTGYKINSELPYLFYKDERD
jgi:hypothetical protein